MTEAERTREVLRALCAKAEAGDARARRYLGEVLGIAPDAEIVIVVREVDAGVPRP